MISLFSCCGDKIITDMVSKKSGSLALDSTFVSVNWYCKSSDGSLSTVPRYGPCATSEVVAKVTVFSLDFFDQYIVHEEFFYTYPTDSNLDLISSQLHEEHLVYAKAYCSTLFSLDSAIVALEEESITYGLFFDKLEFSHIELDGEDSAGHYYSSIFDQYYFSPSKRVVPCQNIESN